MFTTANKATSLDIWHRLNALRCLPLSPSIQPYVVTENHQFLLPRCQRPSVPPAICWHRRLNQITNLYYIQTACSHRLSHLMLPNLFNWMLLNKLTNIQRHMQELLDWINIKIHTYTWYWSLSSSSKFMQWVKLFCHFCNTGGTVSLEAHVKWSRIVPEFQEHPRNDALVDMTSFLETRSNHKRPMRRWSRVDDCSHVLVAKPCLSCQKLPYWQSSVCWCNVMHNNHT